MDGLKSKRTDKGREVVVYRDAPASKSRHDENFEDDVNAFVYVRTQLMDASPRYIILQVYKIQRS